MSFLVDVQLIGTELLTEFGELVSFSRKVEGAYNITTGSTGNSTDTTFSGYGISDPFKNSEVDNNTILYGDINLYLQAGTLPVVGDVATFNSISYRVMNVIPIRVQGGNALYQLQLRI